MRRVDYRELSEKLRAFVLNEIFMWMIKEVPFELHYNAKFLAIRCACSAFLSLELDYKELLLVEAWLKDFEEGLFTVPIYFPGTCYYKVGLVIYMGLCAFEIDVVYVLCSIFRR
jgi:uncharacterized membrane protein YhdT